MPTFARVTVLGCLLVSLGAGGCGTEEPKENQNEAAADEAVRASKEDTDGDGVYDIYDEDPNDASVPGNAAAEEEAGTESTRVRVGKRATDDGLSFKVVSFEQVTSIPATDEFSQSVSPKQGADLYKAVVEVGNVGKTSNDTFCGGGGVVLIDTDDRNFQPIDITTTNSVDSVWCAGGVAPGFTESVTLGFHVPKKSTPGELAFWDGESDDYNGDEHDVRVAVP
jgi:hypothetical protein